MAGMGRLPKPAAERRNRTRIVGARTLRPAIAPPVETPALPVRESGWHPLTVSYWEAVWRSPMAPEYDECDLPSLVQLIDLVDEFHRAESASTKVKLAAEIRLQRQCFGLTPLDRRRLAWEIDRGEEAEQRRESRRRPKAVVDPRKAAGGSKRAASGGGTGA